MGKMSSSAAMASVAARRSSSPMPAKRSAAASTRGKRARSPGVQNACTPGVDEREVHGAVELVVGALGLVP